VSTVCCAADRQHCGAQTEFNHALLGKIIFAGPVKVRGELHDTSKRFAMAIGTCPKNG